MVSKGEGGARCWLRLALAVEVEVAVPAPDAAGCLAQFRIHDDTQTLRDLVLRDGVRFLAGDVRVAGAREEIVGCGYDPPALILAGDAAASREATERPAGA